MTTIEGQLAAFISDLHVPFHDIRAVELACLVLEYVKPGLVVIGGDRQDFYALSAFDKNPERVLELQDELDDGEAIGRMLNDAAGETEVVELIGNHEARLERYLRKHPEVWSLEALSLPRLLKHEELGWRMGGERLDLLNGRLRLKHGDVVRKHSAYTAKAENEKVKHQVNTISGHSHRMGAYFTTGPRHTVGSWEAGCLCTVDPEWTDEPDWQQGMVLVEMSDNPQVYHFQVYQVVFTGKRPKRARCFGKEFVVR